MEPTWQTADGRVRLYLADCLPILPSVGPVDAIITDPVWPNVPDGMFDIRSSPFELLEDALSWVEAKRIAIIMRTDSDPRILTAVPGNMPFIRHQNLEYVATGYLGRVLGGMEVVYGFGRPIASAPGRRVIPGNSDRVQPTGVRIDHPCPRHPEHMAFVVKWWSDPDETVLDQFMGSGTTGVACVRLGRRFIGIEKEPKYFDIAKRRIQEALGMEVKGPSGLTQRRMFSEVSE